MAWTEESTNVYPTSVRPKTKVFDDEQEFAAVPVVFGVKKVPAVALEHSFNRQYYFWRAGGKDKTADTDPTPNLSTAENIRRIIERLLRRIATYKVPDLDDYTTDRDGYTRPIKAIRISPLYISRFRTGALVRWVKRIHTNDSGTNAADPIPKYPVGGDFGGSTASTINDAISDTRDQVTNLKNYMIDARNDLQELYRTEQSKLLGRPVSETNPATSEELRTLNVPGRHYFILVPAWIDAQIAPRGMLADITHEIDLQIGYINRLYSLPTYQPTNDITRRDRFRAAAAAIFDNIDTQNGLIAYRLERFPYEFDSILKDIKRDIAALTPDADKTYLRKYYTGRFGFCYGEIDKYIRLEVNNTRVPQSFSFGDNVVVHPDLLGGAREQGGRGGIGSLDLPNENRNPRVLRMFPGSRTQLIPRFGSTELANNYRGTATIAFDFYNWGGDTFPNVNAVIQRTNKLLTGHEQWYPAKAVACSETLEEGGDYTVVFSIDDSTGMQLGFPVSRKAAVLTALDAVFRRIYDLIQDDKKINAYIYGWSDDVGTRTFLRSEGIVNAINFVGFSSGSPWDYKGSAGSYTFGNFTAGVDQLTHAINDARSRFPNDRPIYAFFISDASTDRLTDAASSQLATLASYSNVTLRAISIYISSRSRRSSTTLNQIDETGNPFHLIRQSDGKTDRLSQEILNILDSVVVNVDHMNPCLLYTSPSPRD